MITQQQQDVLRQPTRELSVKIDILNSNEKVVDNFQGVATDGTVSMDAQSTYRRSGNITIVVDKDSLLPAPGASVWLDKRCGIEVGVRDYSGEIVWFNLGRFAMTNVNIDKTGTEQTVRIELKDYMAFLDGTLGGELAEQITIPRGEITIAHALRTVLSDLGRVSIENIGVDEIDAVVPYDIEKPSGSTVYDIANELVTLYRGYDFYFDADGYLIVEKIKNHSRSPLIESFNGDSRDLTIDRSSTFDFANVRNSVTVWGEQLDDGTQPTWTYRNRYSRRLYGEMLEIANAEHGDICFIEDSAISYMWSEIQYIGIAVADTPTAPRSPNAYDWTKRKGTNGVLHEGQYVHIRFSDDGGTTFTGDGGNEAGAWIGTYADKQFKSSNDPADYRWTATNEGSPAMMVLESKGGFHYIFVRYSNYSQGGRFSGEDMRTTPRDSAWVILDFNVVPEFNMEQVGEKVTVVSDGQIFNDEQAMLESEYELEQRSNFAETISISTVPLYYLDVNRKIRVLEEQKAEDYLITSLSIPLSVSGTMTISGTRLSQATNASEFSP